jgi:hypothetical protein
VQERIMIVSNQRCNVFKTFLRREQADTNFNYGAATTISGVLGAVLPGVQASRNLAGMAGIFSGLQAEYNQNYYSNLMASVITQGIDVRRDQAQERIRRDGQSKSIEEYSLEAAIRDAVYFDGLCSTLTGLEEAQTSIQQTTNPGIERAVQTMTSIKAAYEISQGVLTDLESNGKLDGLLKRTRINTSPLAASFTPKGQVNPNNTQLFAQARFAPQNLLDRHQELAVDVHRTYKAHVDTLSQSLEKTDAGKASVAKLIKPDALKTQFEQALRSQLLDGRGFEPATKPDKTSCKEQIDAAELEWVTAELQLRNVDIKNDDAKSRAKAISDLAQNKAQALLRKIDTLTNTIQKDMERIAAEWKEWMGSGKNNLWLDEGKDKPPKINFDKDGKAIEPPAIAPVISKDLVCKP